MSTLGGYLLFLLVALLMVAPGLIALILGASEMTAGIIGGLSALVASIGLAPWLLSDD